ncbi:methyltransferase domain-containing protein [Rhodocyclus tenuis]|uniref:Malonyl-[acyl-carrier protein] O-methyltransferase n=1 Tax=Rhodocyclus gracilis TaxID=2929842 RepID=A0ABX0WEY6_9RHOO|nr:methyltransferase domain-containing protein [Rhodocyclus gracilis]NJA88202.1 methyltransferase domain-containing protein [Rhodocyclus gracilis]
MTRAPESGTDRAAIDRRRVQANFARAAGTYASLSVVQREIARRLFEHLDPVRIAPRRILDLGCGSGADLLALHERYPGAAVLGADLSPAMLREAQRQQRSHSWLLPFLRRARAPLLAADAAALPLSSASVGFIWSNLMLHWLSEPRSVFAEAHRLLETGGLLMFSTLGPDSLKELRAAFATAYGGEGSEGSEGRAHPDPHAHTHRFVDMHDLGDMLVESGFADPVMNMETLTLTYPSLSAALADLRAGGGCALRSRRRGLMGRREFERFTAACTGSMQEGRLPITLEVIYGHAWRAESRRAEDGLAIVRFVPPRTHGAE